MIIDIIILIILITINGIFSASEIAFLSINKYELSRLIKNGNKKAIKIERILNDTSTFLSTIQIAITLSGFLASAFAADRFADEILKYITIDYLSLNTLRNIIIIIVTIILSYFSLVFGELIPKKIGMAYPMKVSLIMIKPINIVSKICYPFIKILSASTNLFTRLLHIKKKTEEYSEEDIKKAIMNAESNGIIEKFEKELILKVFDFNDTKIKDIMTPIKDVIFINANDDMKSIISIIKYSKYTRFPVYEEQTDNVIGILNVKDLLMQKEKITDIHSIIRKPYNISYDTNIDDTFFLMKQEHIGLGIVKANQNVIGIVTMEDIVEEIVGNIYDEYDFPAKKESA